MMHVPPSARQALPCYTCSTDQEPPLDESEFLQRWDRDIRQAAISGASRLSSSVVDADDLAQAARYQLLRATQRRPITSPHYIRRLIRNAILSALRVEAKRLSRRVDLTEDIAAPVGEDPDDLVGLVTVWIKALPNRLQLTYDALYVRRLTQRSAGRELGISQPRVAQLHATILKRGRRTLLSAVA